MRTMSSVIELTPSFPERATGANPFRSQRTSRSTIADSSGHSPAVPVAHATPQVLLGPLLRQVSRSFHLTLKALPASVRDQIGLGYLLARATDTIADTDVLPLEERLSALDRLRSLILGNADVPMKFEALAANQALPAERHLLE